MPDALAQQIVAGLRTLRVADVADVCLVALFLWGGFIWLRRSRARLAFLGLAYVALVYFIARQLQLQLTAWMLQGFFAVFVIVLVVVFQEDLRRFFEHIALWGLRRRPEVVSAPTLDILAGTVAHLAERSTGALIVLAGTDPLDRHLERGTVLEGKISEPLLLSLFDAGSPGHDGAVVLDGDMIRAFGAHLPLSGDHDQIGPRGTRHTAALGLAERADALIIVVSEETGSISIAHQGTLRTLSGPSDLTDRLRAFQAALEPTSGDERFSLHALARHWRSALLSLFAAAVLWLGLVAGAVAVQETRTVAVVVKNLPPDYSLVSVEPPVVAVVLSGPRRGFWFADRGALRIELDGFLVKVGRRTFEVTEADVRRPTGMSIDSIGPRSVRLVVTANAE